MAKAKRAYVCNDCGADFPRWQGQCNACGAWNTITEVRIAASPTVARNERLTGYAGSATEAVVQTLSEINLQEVPRFTSGFKELDRVLGGGVVPGAAILIGGETPLQARRPGFAGTSRAAPERESGVVETDFVEKDGHWPGRPQPGNATLRAGQRQPDDVRRQPAEDRHPARRIPAGSGPG